jgi:hypothetical protein
MPVVMETLRRHVQTRRRSDWRSGKRVHPCSRGARIATGHKATRRLVYPHQGTVRVANGPDNTHRNAVNMIALVKRAAPRASPP